MKDMKDCGDGNHIWKVTHKIEDHEHCTIDIEVWFCTKCMKVTYQSPFEAKLVEG